MSRPLRRVLPLALTLSLFTATLGHAAPKPSSHLPQVVPAPFVFEKPLPASAPVPLTWFDDAVIIGDSRAQGLRDYLGEPEGLWLTQMGLNVRTARTSTAFLVDGRRVSVAQAMEGKRWGKVYLTLGVNEAAWMEEETFLREYAGLIDDLRAIQPHIPIYLQTIIPVTLSRASARAPGNDLLAGHSALLIRLAREKGVYLVDAAAALTGPSGALPAEYSADGLHLSDEGNRIWLSFLRTHTME